MHKKIFGIILACCLLPLLAQSQQAVTTLTIKKIALASPSGSYEVRSISLVDEKGKAVTFPNDIDSWFENATLQNIFLPKGTSLTLSTDAAGKIQMVPTDDARLSFTFKVDETEYPIGVGVGTKLVVQKTSDGKYKLLPKETAEISPAPTQEKE
ncbi:MAG: hypothetical protein LBG19_05355 [Prevotellaceae bacterium]|jgi:hypothetical protein|nr:hypothetical protein [Prevotellaceae bacterium]